MASAYDLARAIQMAVRAHGDAIDRAGQPSIRHSLRVMEAVLAKDEEYFEAGVAAVLHDVVEDTNVTQEEIAEVFGKDAVHLVDLLTRKSTDTYKQYLERLCSDPLAREIKMADVQDNLFRREGWPQAPYDRYIKTYLKLKEFD